MEKKPLTEEHYKLIIELKGGADVLSQRLADMCRDIESQEEKLLIITEPKFKYRTQEKTPFFGAVPTFLGIEIAKRELSKTPLQGVRVG